MYKNIFSLISGLVFGIGLTIGGMTNPAKVLAFLNITENFFKKMIFLTKIQFNYGKHIN